MDAAIDTNHREPIANPETEVRKTRAATKTRMAGHQGPGLHYKHVRTTVVLLMSSTIFREFSPQEQQAFREIERLNFDLSAAGGTSLEYAFAKLDDEVMARARAQYEFVANEPNSIRNHYDRIATCRLCGKGDSKDDGSNKDKLQYDFRLQNTEGGADLWVGSDCIVNFGLKVRGAETSEEARAILERNLRQCMSLWKKEAWRNEHPDHVELMKHFHALEDATGEFKYYGKYGRRGPDIAILGQSQNTIFRRCQALLRCMRGALRFYQRTNYLTPSKTEEWRQTKLWLFSLGWLTRTLDTSAQMTYEQREDFLRKARVEREAKIEALRTRRTPRAMPATPRTPRAMP